MKYEKMNLKDAYTLVKGKRALINPNRGFWLHLIEYERKLFDNNTVTMKETKYGKKLFLRIQKKKSVLGSKFVTLNS